MFKVTLYQPKLGLAYPPKSIWKKYIKIFGRCILLVCTVLKGLHIKKSSNSPLNFFVTYAKTIYYTLFTVTVLFGYSQWQKRSFMHNRVRKKQDVFKQPCQSLSTNSELLPASAYNFAIRCSVRSLTMMRSASIFFRLKARDCFFLGWVGLAWGKYFGYVREIHI
jgi:hypothetical protein